MKNLDALVFSEENFNILKDAYLELHQQYVERGDAMAQTGHMVRSIYVCAKCGKRFLIIGESYCHCPETVKPRKAKE